MSPTAPTIDRSAALFKAFTDPTRLRLLNLLREGECCVCDLVAVIGGPQPKISRHLAYLRRAGLVETRKQGLWVHYRLTEPTCNLHRRLIECVGSCFGEVPQLQKDLHRLRHTHVSSEARCESPCE